MIIKTRFKRAFSLIELLISLIVISCITAAFTPIITKKFSSGVFGGSSGSNGWSDECKDISPNCKLCFKGECIMCNLDCTIDGQYKDTPSCKCLPCTDKFGSNCTKCESDKCESCLDGSYLDNGNCIDCKSKFEHCTKCDKNECKTCETNYKLDNGKCVPDCTKFFNENCTSCDELTCKTCKPNYDLVGNDCIANCPTKFGKNCLTCTTSACTSCKTGYAINNDTCISCTEKFGTGCSECTTTGCSACKNGYILSNGTCSSCSDKFSSNCTACNSTACTACASGYVLGSSPTSASACISSECAEALARNTFCTGDNYMGICTKDNKAICVTRKNMGDSTTLTIPSRVNVVSVNQNTCLASSTNFCCWKGNTSGTNCNNLYGNYSGCYRTVCDKYAAAYICNSFRGGGKTWRLPTLNEMSNWIDYSNYAVNNPLQLCSTTPSHSLTYCGQEKFCLGSAHYYTGSDGERLNHGCTPPGVWSSEKIEGTVVDYGYYSMLEYPWIQYGGNATNGMSVRCVTDLY